MWFGTWGHIGRGSGFPGEVRVIPPIGIVGISNGALGGGGLYCPTVFTHSDIKSFIEGVIGHCSAGCIRDWKLVQGLDCAGFSFTACT